MRERSLVPVFSQRRVKALQVCAGVLICEDCAALLIRQALPVWLSEFTCCACERRLCVTQ